MDVTQAMEKINSDSALQARFKENPQAMLAELGVDLTPTIAAVPASEASSAHVCVEVGVPYLGCHKVGSDIH